MTGLAAFLPILDWGRRSDRDTLASDLLAAVISPSGSFRRAWPMLRWRGCRRWWAVTRASRHCCCTRRPELAHVVLQCSAINAIDASALESLEAIDQRLRGQVFLTRFQAQQQLTAEIDPAAVVR